MMKAIMVLTELNRRVWSQIRGSCIGIEVAHVRSLEGKDDEHEIPPTFG